MANLLGRRYSQSSVGRAASILEPRDRSKLLAITLVQVIMGFLDLIGVIAIGALGALSVQGVESHKPGVKNRLEYGFCSPISRVLKTAAGMVFVVP